MLHEVMRLMEENDIHHLPVIDADRQVVGMISDVDLDRTMTTPAAAAGDQSARVERFMTRDVSTISRHDSPLRALRSIVAGAFHSVPVVD